MNSFFKTVLMGILLCVTFASQAEAVFRDTNGHTTKLSDLKGKWVMINYWAEWCGTCVEEIPQLNKFYKKYKDKVAFFSVNYDVVHSSVSPEKHQKIIKNLHIQYPVLESDPGKHFKFGKFRVIPVTVIINPEGKMVQKIYSSQTVSSLHEALEKAKSKYKGKEHIKKKGE